MITTCGGLAAPGGSTINSLQLNYKYDADFGFGGPGSVQSDHDVLGTELNFFDNAVFQTVTEGLRPYISNISTASPTGAQLAAVAAGTQIRWNWQNAVNSITGASADFQWVIDYTPTAVPEPATLSLVGAGLLGLVFVARHRRQLNS